MRARCHYCNEDFNNTFDMQSHQADFCSAILGDEDEVSYQTEYRVPRSLSPSFSVSMESVVSVLSQHNQSDELDNSKINSLIREYSQIALTDTSIVEDSRNTSAVFEMELKENFIQQQHQEQQHQPQEQLCDQQQQPQTNEAPTTIDDSMDSKDFLDWMVKSMQTMGQKLVEYDTKIHMLQSDNEYLRTENTKLKNNNKVNMNTTDNHSTSNTSECCCEVTVREMKKLKAEIKNLTHSVNNVVREKVSKFSPIPVAGDDNIN